MILEWLLSPMDPARPHDVGAILSWHARVMVIGWGILTPLAIMIARFFKVLPGQDWPRELDNKVWWRWHWMSQALVLVLSVVGLSLVLLSPQNSGSAILHRVLGYAVLGLAVVQAVSGLFRGSKGGPTDRRPDGSLRGDHYDMTPHRLLFEAFHKSCGYIALALAVLVISTGLWEANAPRWMGLSLVFWWLGLVALFLCFQRQGRAVGTYQAIWGPGQEHPGNRMVKRGEGGKQPVFPDQSYE